MRGAAAAAITKGMSEKKWECLGPVVIESCLGLFESYGVPLQYAGGCPAVALYGQGMVGIIGFSSPQLRGSLLIASTIGLIQMSYPLDPRLVRDPASDLRDWSGELANQLMGRIEHRLILYGVSLALHAPLCLVCRELRTAPDPEEARVFQFKGRGSEMYLRLDVTLASSFALRAVPERVAGKPKEGEVVFF